MQKSQGKIYRTVWMDQVMSFKGRKSRIVQAVTMVLVLILFGLMYDAFNGFYILRNAKSWPWGIGGLALFGLACLIGEAVATWLDSKDHTSHPLYKRVFHLFLLLCFVGVFMAGFGFVFKRLGW